MESAVETLTDAFQSGTFSRSVCNISFHEFPHLSGNINHPAQTESFYKDKDRQADGQRV